MSSSNPFAKTDTDALSLMLRRAQIGRDDPQRIRNMMHAAADRLDSFLDAKETAELSGLYDSVNALADAPKASAKGGKKAGAGST